MPDYNFSNTIPSGTSCWYDSATQSVQCANTGSVTRPRVVTTSGGNSGVTVQTNPNTGQVQISQNAGNPSIQQWIDAALSGLALFRNAPYVPTTTQPNAVGGGGNYPAQNLTPEQMAMLYGSQNQGLGLDAFIQNNKGMLLIGGIALVLLFMKPPSRK